MILFPIIYVRSLLYELFKILEIIVQLDNTYINDLFAPPRYIIAYSTGILIEQCRNILSWTFFVEYVTQLVKGVH